MERNRWLAAVSRRVGTNPTGTGLRSIRVRVSPCVTSPDRAPARCQFRVRHRPERPARDGVGEALGDLWLLQPNMGVLHPGRWEGRGIQGGPGAQGSPGHRGRRRRCRRCRRCDRCDRCDRPCRRHRKDRRRQGYGPPPSKPWSGSAPASAAGKPCRAMPANAGGDGRRFPDRECQIDHIKRCPWQSCRPPHYVAHSANGSGRSPLVSRRQQRQAGHRGLREAAPGTAPRSRGSWSLRGCECGQWISTTGRNVGTSRGAGERGSAGSGWRCVAVGGLAWSMRRRGWG